MYMYAYCIKKSRFSVKLKTPNQKQEALQSFHRFLFYEHNGNIFWLWLQYKGEAISIQQIATAFLINHSTAQLEAATNLISRTRGSFSFDSVPVGNISSVYVQLLRKLKSFFWTEFRG